MDGQEGLLKKNSLEQLIQKKKWKTWIKNVNFFVLIRVDRILS